MQDAEVCYREVALSCPDDADIYNRWAAILYSLGRYTDAVQAFRHVTEITQNDPASFYRLGAALHAAGLPDQALLAFRKSVEIDANNVRAYHAMGMALTGLHRYGEAIEAYKQALHISESDTVALAGLGDIYCSLGKLDDAVMHFERLLSIKSDSYLVRKKLGMCLQNLGRLEEGTRQLRSLVHNYPNSADARSVLADALSNQGDVAGAIKEYKQSIALDPENGLIHTRLGDVYRKMEQCEMALDAYRAALQHDPALLEAYIRLSLLLEQSNLVDELELVLSKGLELAPDEPFLNLVMAMTERRHGKFEYAIDRLEQLLESKTDRVRKTMELPDYDSVYVPEVFREGLEQNYIKPNIYYELGLSYDGIDRPDEAFRCFQEGNRLCSQTTKARKLDKSSFLRKSDDLKLAASTGCVTSRSGIQELLHERTPVFLVGFPRSGTTLLNQILYSHPDVQVLEEKPVLSVVEEELAKLPGGFPAALGDLSIEDIKHLQDVYFRAVDSVLKQKPGTVLIDKLPLNISRVGLIWQLFPGARFIFAVRHPCDVTLSCFMQNFEPNEATVNFFTLEETATLYARIMDTWFYYQHNLPISSYMVRYEDLLGGIEEAASGMLEYIDMEWNANLLEFDKKAVARGFISTPSYRQVVQPIYQTAKYRWQRYGKYFNCVLPILQPYIEKFGYHSN